MFRLNLRDLNNPHQACPDYQCLKQALMMGKLKRNLMYQWKHLVKLLTAPSHHPPKKETISIMSHTLKKKTNPRKYKCKICSVVLDSVHELTTHHQTKHNILYCSTCKRAFNNSLSLSRHEYKHKHKDLQYPKCDRTFTFGSQVKAHMFSH